MSKKIHINTITKGDSIQLSKKDFESIFEVMDGLDEKNLQIIKENERLKQKYNNSVILSARIQTKNDRLKDENEQLKQSEQEFKEYCNYLKSILEDNEIWYE